MNLSRNNKITLALSISLLVASCIILGAAFTAFSSHNYSIKASDGTGPHGQINVLIERNGIIVYNYTNHNIFTNYGGNLVRNALGWDNVTGAADDIAVGNMTSTPAVTDTKLSVEDATVCDRSAGTPAVGNFTYYTVQKQWSSVAGAVTLNATALHLTNTSDAEDAVAVATMTQAILIAGDSLTITWTVYSNSGT